MELTENGSRLESSLFKMLAGFHVNRRQSCFFFLLKVQAPSEERTERSSLILPRLSALSKYIKQFAYDVYMATECFQLPAFPSSTTLIQLSTSTFNSFPVLRPTVLYWESLSQQSCWNVGPSRASTPCSLDVILAVGWVAQTHRASLVVQW